MVRFLINEDLPRSACNLIRRYGYEAIDVRDIGLRGAKDSDIGAYAQREAMCPVTGDFGFADIRNYPPGNYSGLVVLGIPRDATASMILHLLDGFLKDAKLISELPSKLAIVEPGRVRIRGA